MAEYWDIYEMTTGRFVMTFEKGSGLVPAGMYHETVQVFTTDKAGHILLTRRSFMKSEAAGDYEFTAGSVQSGESPLKAAKRELREETGLTAKTMTKLCAVFLSCGHGNFIKRYMYMAYVPDLQSRTITLEPSETIGYKITTMRDVYEMFRDSSLNRSVFEGISEKTMAALEAFVGEAESQNEKKELELVPATIKGSIAVEVEEAPKSLGKCLHPFLLEAQAGWFMHEGTFHPAEPEQEEYP